MMKVYLKLFLFLFLALSCSFCFGAEIQSPQITVHEFFADIIISSKYNDWDVHFKSGEFSQWPQTGLRQEKLSSTVNDFIPLISLHDKPVVLNSGSKAFFEGVPQTIPNDGTIMGFKYVFLPRSVLSPLESKSPEEPLLFYLTKKIPDVLNGDEFQDPPTFEEVRKIIDSRMKGYVSYYSALSFEQTCKEMHESLLSIAADYKHPRAQLECARIHQSKGNDRDAREFYKQSVCNGKIPVAQLEYAFMLYRGKGGDQDLPTAREFLRRAAEQGNALAQTNYASMLYQGEGGDRDLPTAREFFKRAAELGNARAQYNYALMLQRGEGGARNLPTAREFFKRGAEQGDALAQANYASMLYRGEGGDRDLPTAREFYKRGAEQGNARAQANYASMLYRGEGGDRDLATAREFFRRAAEQGNALAQNVYGGMLYRGEGGDQDLPTAREFFRRAAEQGNALAQTKYASMLYRGEGGDRDLPTAREFYKRAAEQGNTFAQTEYASMLRQDEGGDRDVQRGTKRKTNDDS